MKRDREDKAREIEKQIDKEREAEGQRERQ
jgi:hypothetical protein